MKHRVKKIKYYKKVLNFRIPWGSKIVTQYYDGRRKRWEEVGTVELVQVIEEK